MAVKIYTSEEGRKYKVDYESYERWYNKATEKNPNMYHPKMTESEYIDSFVDYSLSGTKNISRTAARAQRIYTRQFEREIKKEIGMEITGTETKEDKVNMFWDYVHKKEQEGFTDKDNERLKEIKKTKRRHKRGRRSTMDNIRDLFEALYG